MYNVKPQNRLNRDEDGIARFTITDETDWVTDDPIGFEEVPEGVIITRLASGRFEVDCGEHYDQFIFYVRIHSLFRTRLQVTVNAGKQGAPANPAQLEIPTVSGTIISNDFQSTLPNAK